MDIKNRIVGMENVDPLTLTAHPCNWRGHPEYQRGALSEALDTVGFVKCVVVNKTTGHILDGHLRVESAIAKGQKLVPVVYVELDEDEEKIALATHDSITMLAGINNDKLKELEEGLSFSGENLSKMMDDMIAEGEGQFEPIDLSRGEIPTGQTETIIACPGCGFRFYEKH